MYRFLWLLLILIGTTLTAVAQDDDPIMHVTPPNSIEYQVQTGEGLVELSQKFNICMNVLIDLNPFIYDDNFEGGTIVNIPFFSENCYDDDGRRLHYADRAIHEVQSGEWLYLISREYNVCVNDLYDHNPHMNRNRWKLPPLIFIPDTGCYNDAPALNNNHDYATTALFGLDETLVHEVQPGDSLIGLSYIYNVCYNRIIDANPHISDFASEYFSQNTDVWDTLLMQLPESEVSIPDRPPCYSFYDATYQLRNYLCYDIAIDFTVDYSEYESPVSPTSDGAFCYPYDKYDDGYSVVHNNEVYSYLDPIPDTGNFNRFSYISSDIQWCYNNWDLQPQENYQLYRRSGYLYISDSMNDCFIYLKSGEDTIIRIDVGDTLSRLAVEHGKSIQSLIDANGMTNPHYIFYGQPFIIPDGINLWHALFGGIALMVMLSGGFIIMALTRLRQRARGDKPKRKTKDA